MTQRAMRESSGRRARTARLSSSWRCGRRRMRRRASPRSRWWGTTSTWWWTRGAQDAPYLEAAVRLARILALAKLDERDVDVDAAAIARALQGVREQLDAIRALKVQLTSVSNATKAVWTGLDTLRNGILARVAEAEAGAARLGGLRVVLTAGHESRVGRGSPGGVPLPMGPDPERPSPGRPGAAPRRALGTHRHFDSRRPVRRKHWTRATGSCDDHMTGRARPADKGWIDEALQHHSGGVLPCSRGMCDARSGTTQRRGPFRFLRRRRRQASRSGHCRSGAPRPSASSTWTRALPSAGPTSPADTGVVRQPSRSRSRDGALLDLGTADVTRTEAGRITGTKVTGSLVTTTGPWACSPSTSPRAPGGDRTRAKLTPASFAGPAAGLVDQSAWTVASCSSR